MANTLLILALVCAGVYVIFSMMIVRDLSKRRVKINYFLLRLFLIKYISQYKQIMLKETGKVGPLYYPCIVSVGLALVLAIAGLILR
ncbi:MAG: hypothetical protein H6P98_489 [Candidatus Aminicenantes bacterium]|nr:hypothetical protein [Candidatus Aminicenantes bacterium]